MNVTLLQFQNLCLKALELLSKSLNHYLSSAHALKSDKRHRQLYLSCCKYVYSCKSLTVKLIQVLHAYCPVAYERACS